MQNKMIQQSESKKRIKDLAHKIRVSNETLAVKQEESAYNKAVEKEEKTENKRLTIEKNLEKERRKMEWKKTRIMTKERMNEERLKFIKAEEQTIMKSLAELNIQQ